ncbi:MAG: hypothetical protein EP343_12440 [Deltaproteobacteria bacterium]|nr:MAG: hypothetical protein EP343_12440 [Deltaproteobacteria bacterium]
MLQQPSYPTQDELDRDLRNFRPYRGDPLLSGLLQTIGYHPLWIAGCYTLLGLGGVILLTLAAGTTYPHSPRVVELLEDTGELVNLGVMVPIGAFLVLHFYHQFTRAIRTLMEDGVLLFSSGNERREFLIELESRLYRPWFALVSAMLSLAVNVWILLSLKNHWNSLDQGFVAIWFRFLSFINYYMVFMMLLKGVATTRAIRWIFKSDIVLQPIHPDRCAGLQPLGAISGSLNVFLALLTSYITVLVELEGVSLAHPAFLIPVSIFAVLATYLFVAPISAIHHRMKAMRREIQISLNHEFQKSFQQVHQRLSHRQDIDVGNLQRLDALEKLHTIAARMPVWPIDMETVIKFFAVVGVPTLLGLAKTFLLPLFAY